MAHYVAPAPLSLPPTSPVKWTALQERAINKEYPIPQPSSSELPNDYVLRTYLQFLWLPESVMSLRYLCTALLRVSLQHSPSLGSSLTTTAHPLHQYLRPLLLTPRTAAQKYYSRFSQIVDDDGGPGGLEEDMMWFAYKNEKVEEEQTNPDENTFDMEDRWKNNWLERMEIREVQIQILLHFLLLSLPGAPSPIEDKPHEPVLPPSLSPSKNRKRRHREPFLAPPALSMQACLESFMDKMSMWQLMASLNGGDSQRDNYAHTDSKGKQKAQDERDWMQIFCEDIVELQFKDKLPDLCALLRSKVFQSSPFGDDSDSLLSSSPPTSPRTGHKRLKPSEASSSMSMTRLCPVHSQAEVHGHHSKNANTSSKQARDLQRSRSRALSVSLEEERARSRSMSVGPGNLRKNLLTREVSMTTAFKGKAKAREREQLKTAAAKVKAAEDNKKAALAAKARPSSKGITLVAATPVKPKERAGQFEESQASSQPSQIVPRLPMCDLSGIVEGGDDDDDWTLPSSPDVLLLGASSQGQAPDGMNSDEEDDVTEFFGSGRLETPTKPRLVRKL